MASNKVDRPTSVSVIGWTFIILSGFAILSGIFSFLMKISLMQFSGEFSSVPPTIGMPFPFKIFHFFFDYIWLLAILQIFLAIFCLIAGMNFLKMRHWAKVSLEVVTWMALIFLVSYGIFFAFSWIAITGQIGERAGAQGPPPFFDYMGILVMILVMAMYVSPLVIILKFLRGKPMRELFSKARAIAQGNRE